MSVAHLGMAGARRGAGAPAGGLHTGIMEQRDQPSFASLMQHDVGLVVLRHLASTQQRLRTVSKECRQLVDSSVHSLKCSLGGLASDSATLPLAFPQLQDLAFDRRESGASVLLAHLAQHRPGLLARLRRLDLSTCEGMEAGALEQVLRACRSLASLALPPLSAGVASTREQFVDVLCAHGGQLTELLGAGDYADAGGVAALSRLGNLASLDLSPGRAGAALAPPALAPLAALTRLQRLQLGNDLAAREAAALAASLPRLSSLAFTYVGDGATAPSDLEPLARSAGLRELALCGVAAGDELLALLARTPVAALRLGPGCTFVATPSGAAAVARQLTSLAVRVSDRDVHALAAALPQLAGLQGLSLAVHRAAEPCDGLLRAVFGLAELRSLRLESHYNGLREEELEGLPALRQLASLQLSNHFDDATMCRLLRCAPNLRRLSLSGCGLVGDTGLACAAWHCRQLCDVRLELMRGVTAAGVAALAAAPRVSHVVLEGCRNVPADEASRVARLLDKPGLEVVKQR